MNLWAEFPLLHLILAPGINGICLLAEIGPKCSTSTGAQLSTGATQSSWLGSGAGTLLSVAGTVLVVVTAMSVYVVSAVSP